MDTTDANVIPYHKSNRGRAVKSATKSTSPPRKRAEGRKAFQGEFCEYHGPAEDGKGCAKFSHLDTSGRGLAKLPFWRTFLATFTKALKPLFIALLFVGLIYIATHFVGRALHIGGGLPSPTNSPMPGSVRPSPNHSVSHRGIGNSMPIPGDDRYSHVPV